MYDHDRNYANQWIPKLRQAIGPHVLRVTKQAEDREEASDLITFEVPPKFRIACRVRRPRYLMYRNEVTFTRRRESGAPCEWDKMILGDWADWFVYAIATAETSREGELCPLTIIDLHVARPYLRKWGTSCRERVNRDESGFRSFFCALPIHQLRAQCGFHVIRFQIA